MALIAEGGAPAARGLLLGALGIATLAVLASIAGGAILIPALAMAAAAALMTVLVAKAEVPALRKALLAAFVLATAWWQWRVLSHQVSDFGVYLRCGRDFSHPWPGLAAWTHRCEGQWLPDFATYWRRSLLYSLPIGWVFDGRYAGFKLVNGVLRIATVVALYVLARDRFGVRAGVLAAVVAAMAPEAWFVGTIVVSDNLVLPVLVLLFWLLAELSERPGVLRGVAALAGLLALDFLRSIGPILLLAVLSMAVLTRGRGRFALLLLAAASAVGLWATTPVTQAFGATHLQHNGLLASLLGTGVGNPRPFMQSYAWNQYVWPMLPPAERSHLAGGWLASELTDPVALPRLWLQKLVALFRGEGYYYFSSAAKPFANPDDFDITGAPSSIAFLQGGADAARGVMAVILAVAALGARRAVDTALGRAALAWVVAFLAFVVFLAEVQPRYGVLLVPGLALLAGAFVAPGPRVAVASMARGAVACVLVAAAGVGLVIGWSHARLATVPVLQWTASTTTCPARLQDVSALRLVIKPDKSGCAQARATLQPADGALVLYLLRDPVPPRWDHKLRMPVAVELVEHRADGSQDRRTFQLAADRAIVEITVRKGTSSFDLVAQPADPDGEALAVGYARAGGEAVRNTGR